MSRKTEQRYITEQADFPTNLRELMKEHNVTQKVLAEVIEMRPQTVSLYIGGQSVPDINTLYKIAEYFNVSADWLIGRPGSSMRVDADVTAAIKYTGLSENALKMLHDLHNTSHEGMFIKGEQVSYINWLSKILESTNDFYWLMGEICSYMVFGGVLPQKAYQTTEDELSIEEWERFHRWVNGHKREIVSREEARELHLQLAGEKLKDICRNILEKALAENKGVEENGKR